MTFEPDVDRLKEIIQSMCTQWSDLLARYTGNVTSFLLRELPLPQNARVFINGKSIREAVERYLANDLHMITIRMEHVLCPVDVIALDNSGYGFFSIPHVVLLRTDRSYSDSGPRELSREEEAILLHFAGLLWSTLKESCTGLQESGEPLPIVVSAGYLSTTVYPDGQTHGFSYYTGSIYDPALEDHFSRLQINFARFYIKIYEGMRRYIALPDDRA